MSSHRIEVSSRLVHYNNVWFHRYHRSYSKPLFLPTRKPDATLANEGIVALRERAKEAMGVGRPRGGHARARPIPARSGAGADRRSRAGLGVQPRLAR